MALSKRTSPVAAKMTLLNPRAAVVGMMYVPSAIAAKTVATVKTRKALLYAC